MPKLPERQRAPRREADVVGEVRPTIIAVPGALSWRNTVGFIKAGDIAPRSIAYGLCEGSADLIACIPTCLTCPDCGAMLPPIGRFVGIEVKGPRTPTTPEQVRWAGLVNAAHGTAGFAHSAGDAAELVQRARVQW